MTEKPQPEKRKVFFSKEPGDFITALLAVVFIVTIFGTVNYLIWGNAQLCIFRALTGLPCPGCGLTHAGAFLLSGELKKSLIWHPFLLPIVITLILELVPCRFFKYYDHKKYLWWKIGLLGCILLYFIVRLIIYFPQPETEGPMYYDNNNYLKLQYRIKDF